MDQIKNSTIRFGTVPSIHWNPGDDRIRSIPVAFSGPPIGPPRPGKPKGVEQKISVIVTPTGNRSPVVAMADAVTPTGFNLRARNSDLSKENDASFGYLAVLGVPQAATAIPPFDARISVLQPKGFGGFLDRRHWPRIWFSVPFISPPPTPPAVLLTPNNLDVHGGRNPAVAGAVLPLEDLPFPDPADGFSVQASNLDTIDGACGFYAAAFASGDPETPTGAATQEIWVDHGSHENTEDFFLNVFPGFPYPVERGGVDGDSRDFAIYFDRPFLSPPAVLASGQGTTPIVTLVRDVTTHGFTVHARNTGSEGGHALFYWVAIGCVDGCG